MACLGFHYYPNQNSNGHSTVYLDEYRRSEFATCYTVIHNSATYKL